MVRMVSDRGLLHHSRLCGSVAELNAGTWVASGESTAAVMPSCCDDANRRKARHNGSRSASWQWCNERRSNHPAPPYANQVRSGADQNKLAALLTGETQEKCCNTRQQLEWEPKSCRLVAWNASQFCSSLGGRGLLVLGDSVSWQWFAELVRAITHVAGCPGFIGDFGVDMTALAKEISPHGHLPRSLAALERAKLGDFAAVVQREA